MWRQGCPESPEWSRASEIPPLAARCMSTATSAGPLKSSAGLVKRGGSALPRGLGAWVSSFELPHDHGSSLPRKGGCMLG